MKNIHLLPTDEPSRLMIDTIENKLYLQPILHKKTINVLPQHIYITSDEEIKEGDWCLCSEELVHKVVEIKSNIGIIRFQDGVTEVLNACKKIILTTDQELIEEGIQAIDDEFLEWFVKNPSCEKVEVEHFGTCCGNQSITQCINCKKYNPVYRIIIPQEDSKQEGYICPHTKIQCDDECCVSAEDCHITFSLASGMVDCDEPKQETLNKINNINEEIKKQINLLEEEQTRVKQFINENNFNCTTAPWVIAKQYRDEIKKHIGILKMNLEK
jgi:hypothetical protein